MRVVIVGGGMAGLAAAWALGRAGVRDIVLVEREERLFSHSSGRNAAIYRVLETAPPLVELSLRSAVLLDELCGGRSEWLNEVGLLLTAARPLPLEPLAAAAAAAHVACSVESEPDLARRAPSLRSGQARAALFVPDAGVLDLHAIQTALTRGLSASVRLSTPVARICVSGERVRGVALEDGSVRDADAVVIASGAWAAGVALGAGAPLPLEPRRRHLVLLEPGAPFAPRSPIVWDVELETYYRPESGALLASPGDAEPWPPELPHPDAAVLELLWHKLGRLAPALARSRVRRSWACLRTFAPDGVPVIGADPRLAGLHWLAGLGGSGMGAGVAAGELCASAVCGTEHPLAGAVSPARLLAAAS